jgi:hypothetical protein
MEKNKIPYIFLTSHAYSGSTLTSFLLGSHPEIATVGMLTGPAAHLDLNTYRCSCGQLFQQDPFWQAVTAAVNRYGISYSLNRHLGTRIELGSNSLLRRIRTDSLRRNTVEEIRDWLMFKPMARPQTSYAPIGAPQRNICQSYLRGFWQDSLS